MSSLVAGDDVKEKKPDPSIYITAAEVIKEIKNIFKFLFFLKLTNFSS